MEIEPKKVKHMIMTKTTPSINTLEENDLRVIRLFMNLTLWKWSLQCLHLVEYNLHLREELKLIASISLLVSVVPSRLKFINLTSAGQYGLKEVKNRELVSAHQLLCLIMEEQPSSAATSGDNFSSYFASSPASSPVAPLKEGRSSPAVKSPSFQNKASSRNFETRSKSPATPSSVSRLASHSSLVPEKPSFMANVGQPWGLFNTEEDNGPTETLRHPLIGNHPLSDDDEDGDLGTSPLKVPTDSASSTTKTFSNSPEAVNSSRPSLNPSPLSFSGSHDMSEVSSLRKLARQGAWRTLVDKVKAAKKRGSLTTPVQELNFATYYLLALMKLRNYGAAVDELAALGDLDAPHYSYDEYPSVYPGKSGSMVPFALRWMCAELPHRTGQTATTMERLYALFAFCSSRIEALEAADGGHKDPLVSPVLIETSKSSDKDNTLAAVEENVVASPELSEDPPAEEVGTSGGEEDFGEFIASETTLAGKMLLTWRKRKDEVVYALVGHHLYQKQFIVALQWLNHLLARSPTDAELLSKVGYVQLQLGDLLGAQQTFTKVDSLLADTLDNDFLNLAGRNRGLLHFAEKEYGKAFNEFTAVLGRNPQDIVSANNKALCLMYSRELLAATSVLEDNLQSSPQSILNETMVLNLCSMYELASMNSVDSKRTLSSWLLNHAADDFDPSCTRL